MCRTKCLMLVEVVCSPVCYRGQLMILHQIKSCLVRRMVMSPTRLVGGYRRENIDMTQDVKMNELISTLKKNERKLLYEKLQKVILEERKMEQENKESNTFKMLWEKSSARFRNYIETPTRSDLNKLFLFHSIPYMAFGFLDNCIMILAGDYIQASIGSSIGLSTLAAAGLGNALADAVSIGLAYQVERLFSKLVDVPSSMTLNQFELKRTRIVIQSARIIGITCGCILGLLPLLFIEKSPF